MNNNIENQNIDEIKNRNSKFKKEKNLQKIQI